MYKMLFAAILLSSSVAFAQGPEGGPPQGGPGGGPGAGDPAQREQTFEQRKAKISQHMAEKIAELQKKKSCVDAAATPEALKTCLPRLGEGRHHKFGDGEGRRKFGGHRKFGGGEGGEEPAAPPPGDAE